MPSGRRCRTAVHNSRLGLCLKHASAPPAAPLPADFRKPLTTGCDDFSTAVGIHNSLSELYKLLAADLIAARRAAVLAYIANLLLRTIPIVQSELNPDSNESIRLDVDFGDLPRPDRSGASNQGTNLPAEPYPSTTTPTVPLCTEKVCS